MNKAYLILTLAGSVSFEASADMLITQWTFDDGTTAPSFGAGSAGTVGGTTGSFGPGSMGSTGWVTSNYPEQSTANGTAGVRFDVSTVGFDFIEVSYQQLASATASRWSEFQYTVDGSAPSPEWVSYASNDGDLSPQDTFTTQTFDLSSVAGVADNPNFAFRIVSVFSPVAFNPGVPIVEYGAFTAYHRSHADSLNGDAYASSGSWEFDNIAVGSLSVVMVPEPSAALLGMSGLGLVFMRCIRRTAC